jgi:uncharacterized protein (TIGR02996 family)
MDIEQSFVEDIVARPDDDAPRLIFADWLEDHGDPQRAEFIRRQCERAAKLGDAGELQSWLDCRPTVSYGSRREHPFAHSILGALDVDESAWSDTEGRSLEAHLEETGRERWLRGLSLPIAFRRGFPERIETGAYEYLQHADILERIAPVQAIRLVDFSPPPQEEDIDWDQADADRLEWTSRLAECPQLKRWRELEFLACPGWDLFDALLSSPHLRNLRRLVATSNEVGGGVEIVADKRFKHLRWLDLHDSDSAGGRPGDTVFIHLVTSPHLARLEYLGFGGNAVRDKGVVALASSPTMGRLRSLSLRSSYLSPAALRALGNSTTLKSLRHLDVSWSLEDSLDDGALAMLLESPLFPKLTLLDICSNEVTDEGVLRLSRSPRAAGLRAVVLGGTRYVRNPEGNHWQPLLTAASVRALAESPWLSGLRRLELPNVPLDDESAMLLARSERLSGLRLLIVDSQPGLTEKGLQALRARFRSGLQLGAS